MKRRKFTSKFKVKVVLEALKEKESLSELSKRHKLHPQQIGTWKRSFLEGAESFFEGGKKKEKSEAEEERDRHLRTIGQLKVENDFLKKSLQ